MSQRDSGGMPAHPKSAALRGKTMQHLTDSHRSAAARGAVAAQCGSGLIVSLAVCVSEDSASVGLYNWRISQLDLSFLGNEFSIPSNSP